MKILTTAISVGIIATTSLMSMSARANAAVYVCRAASKSVPADGGKNMAPAKQLTSGNLYRTRCMIGLILQDLATGHSGVYGGGISSINATSSTSYVVALSQDERIDRLTYEFNVNADGSVSVKSKVASTQSVEPKEKR